MNNKKVQANMQINVSFLGDTTKLVKQLESSVKSLNLESSLTRQLSTSLTKGFKEVYSNIDKMSEGLSKKGLSSKQYTMFFNEMNEKLIGSLGLTKNLKKELQTLFDSSENKQGLKDLAEYKKQLLEIKKLASSQKGAQTRQGTAITKLKDETGLDYNLSKRMINSISARKSNNQALTKNQQEWAAANGLDETKLKRVLELYKQIVAQTRKIDELNKQAKDSTGQGGVDASIDYIEKQIDKLNNAVITPETNKQNMAIATQIEGINQAVSEAADKNLPKFTNELSRSEAEAQKLAQASSTIREIFAQFGITFTAASVVRGFQDLAKSAFEFYKSLDSALNEIYVVSNLSIDQVNKLQTSFINMAKNTGVAIDDVTKSAVLFYQQGLNTNEVLEMTKVTSEFAKVAGIDATDAADKLTAAVNGYCLAASDAVDVADKFNQVAAASAADINELSTAFSKAAAQANQAGVSMDNYLAYIATMEEATREAPENIGTSLKTIFSRMQQIKTGENTEDNVDVNAVETALRSVGIQLRNTEGQLRDLEEIFDELGPKWNTLDRNTQAYLGTIVAGTRQQSRFITLMQNWDRVQDLADESANSAGRQALMHAKAMDSIESKLQQLNVAWQEFVSNLASSDLFKGVIDALTKLLNLVNSGNKPMILLSLAIGALSKKLKELQAPIANKLKDFGSIFSGKNRFTSEEEKQKALDDNSKQLIENNTKLSILYDQHKQKLQEIMALEEQMKNPQNQTQENEDKINQLKKEQLELQNQINQAENQGSNLSTERKKIEDSKIMSKRQKVGSMLSTGGMALSSLGMMSGDTNISGLLGGTGGILNAAGQFATGNYIGGAVSAITAGYQLVKTFQDWDKNLEKKITDAVNKVDSKLESVNNISTGIKATEKLQKRYNELSSKVVKTADEQREFNSIVQEMGDTYGIDVMTDAYGNLAININEVNDALEEEKAKREKAMKELSTQELDSMINSFSGLFNSNKVTDYVDELFKTTSSSYKTLLNGIDDELTDSTRKTTSNVAKAFTSNLKNSMMNEVKNNPFSYLEEGFAKSLTNMESELDDALDGNDWNELYGEIDFLKNNLENMTFDDVQEHLAHFYDGWSGKNNTTKEQWDLLVDSINNTVFENSSLLEFYGKVNDMQSKASGEYYNKQLDKLNKGIDKYKKASAGTDVAGTIAGVAGAGAIGTATAGALGFGVANSWNPAGWIALGVGGLLGIGGAVAAYNSEDNKKQRAMQKAAKELEKQKKEYLKSVADENVFLQNEEDAQRWIDAQEKVANTMKGLTADTQAYLANIKDLYNFDNMGADEAEEYASGLKKALKGLNGLDNEGDKYNYLAEYYRKHKDEMSDQVREQWKNILDQAFDNLSITSTKTFTQIGNELDGISKSLRTMNSLIDEFKENGGMTLDTFMDLANILDNMDIGALGQMKDGDKYIDSMIDSLKNLDLAYDANTGMITMNGDALQNLRNIQEAQTKAKIAGMIADLKASKATTETEIAYIDAQIAGAQAILDSLEAAGKGQISYNELMVQANKATNDSMTKSIENISSNYKNDLDNNNQWKTAIINNLADASKAWNAYYTAMRNGSANVDELYKTATKRTNVGWAGFDTSSGIDWNKYTTGWFGNKQITNINSLKSDVESYIAKLENSKAKYYKTLEVTNAEITMLEGLYNSDLSKLGVKQDSGSKDKNKLEQYIGQLKEIYNILNRIQVLEHRLSTLDTYADISKGAKYGSLLQERLGYNEELLNQYDFLVSEQKKFTNGYKDFINSVEGLEGVFDFDKYGQIIINWEKYTQLQDQAADGEVTLKQKADDVYKTYTEMFKELQSDFDNYIKYLKAVIELEQEMIDGYTATEDRAANAVKEIYKKILDTKLEAIDKEKEAIEDLRKAREEARKDQENAKAITGLQTDIQRAMMDTSGASDSALIKAQQNLDEKLDAIAEDKYSQMLDDILNKLDEESNALQEEFDELWENMDWLFDWLDEEVMRDEQRLLDLFQQTDEWNTSSKLHREQLMQDWNTEFETYMSGLEDGKTIFDVWDNLNANRDRIGKLDESLTSTMSKGSQEIVQTIQSWQKDVNSTINNAVKAMWKPAVGSVSTFKPITTSPASVNQFNSVNKYPLLTTNKKFASGGFADFTGPAWMDGTKEHPEAVLTALQTEHFIKFTNTLDQIMSGSPNINGGNNSSINIDTIEFKVDSMSSAEDGEIAFNTFVNKFKEIGNQTGIKIDTFKNTL